MKTGAEYAFVLLLATSAFAQDGATVKPAEFQASDSVPTLELRAAANEPMAPAPSAVMTTAPAMTAVASMQLRAKAAPQESTKPEIGERERRIWYSLVVADHGGAILDAWSTRQVLSTGGRELDPLVRPFAHSSILYPALQVAPLGMDYFGLRLMRSRNRTLRKLWWVPQGVAAAGSLVCGTLNLSNRR